MTASRLPTHRTRLKGTAPRLRLWFAGAVALAGALGGCARFAYEPGPAPDQAVIDEVMARALPTTDAAPAAAPLVLASAGVPDLADADSLLPVALSNDIELTARLAALDAALAQPGALARWLNPGVSLAVEHHSVRDDVATSNWSVGPEFSVTLRTPADMAARRALAEAQIAAAEAGVRERFWEVTAAVYRAHARYLTAQTIVALTERELALLDEAVSLARTRVDVGLSTPLELSLLSLTRNQTRVQALARAQDVSLAQRALEQSLALGPGGLPAPTERDLPQGIVATDPTSGVQTTGSANLALYPTAERGAAAAMMAPSLEPLIDAALTLRADVMLALARFDEADAGVRQAVAAQYPQLTLNPAYFFDQGDHVWSLVSGLALPLSMNHGPRIEAAVARRSQRLAEFNAVQADVLQELASGRRALELAIEQRAALTAVVADVEGERAVLAGQLAAGVVDPLTLKRAEQQILQIQYNLLTADLNIRLAAIDLAQSAHLLWWPDARVRAVGDTFTTAVNQWLADRRSARGLGQPDPSVSRVSGD